MHDSTHMADPTDIPNALQYTYGRPNRYSTCMTVHMADTTDIPYA